MDKVNLSILICSIWEREKQLKSLISNFQEQTNQGWSYEENPSKYATTKKWTFETFEILAIVDDCRMKVGHKRNILKSFASGKYVCYFDDDDQPSKEYIPEILKAIDTGADVITFKGIHYENGRKVFNVDFGDHGHDHEDDEKGIAYRLPNHLCVWKRELTKRTQFPNQSFGEDGAWARKMNRWIRSTHRINKVLYHYLFTHQGTRTQQHRFR